MKFIIVLISVLIALSSCHTHIPFLDKSDWTLDGSEGNRDNIVDFFEGVFSHFNLSSPSQISDCFCDVNAALYFKLLQQIGRILEDTKDRNSLRLHLEFGKIGLLFHSLKDTHACMFMTQDFTDLLDALNINERNPRELNTFLYLYYQAHYSDLFEGFKPILENLNTQSNNAAGDAFGAILNDTVQTFKTEGLSHIAYAGFGNGGAISLNIDEPDDSLKCYDNNSSELVLEFIYKLAAAVAEGNFKQAPLNALKFMRAEGKKILSQIPKEDLECDAKSADMQELTKRLGIDVSSSEFHDLMLQYISDNRLHYYVFSKSLQKAFDHKNVHHAGSIYSKFLEDVASSKK